MRSGSIMFKPIKVGQHLIKNRFMKSPTWEGLADGDGFVTKKLGKEVIQLARGGVGLLIPGYVYINKHVQALPNQAALYSIAHAEKWKPIVNQAHAHGAKLVFQICHGGPAATPELNDGVQPMGPTEGFLGSRAMTKQDIDEAIDDFITSAKTAHLAGADGVQLHAAHGYLLSYFLSPRTNQRTDKWGGCPENNLRMVKEIVNGIKKELPEDFLLTIKMNGNDKVQGGIDKNLAAQYVNQLDGIDLFEISCGMNNWKETIASTITSEVLYEKLPEKHHQAVLDFVGQESVNTYQEANNLELAQYIKALNPNRTIASVGGHRNFEHMEKIIQRNDVDMISIGRPLIKEPYLINDFLCGKKDQSSCINCSNCHIRSGITGYVRCHHFE